MLARPNRNNELPRAHLHSMDAVLREHRRGFLCHCLGALPDWCAVACEQVALGAVDAACTILAAWHKQLHCTLLAVGDRRVDFESLRRVKFPRERRPPALRRGADRLRSKRVQAESNPPSESGSTALIAVGA